MYPTLIKIGSISISSFSVMVLIGYLAAYYVVELDLVRRGKDRVYADLILIMCVVGGLGGAKILFLFQNATINEVITDPLRYLSSGYTFLGGLTGALILLFLLSIYKKVSFWFITDVTIPGLIIGYAIGRIGCLLVGDDYGVPSELPWAISFPKGSPPTVETVHPTQVYDTICMFLLFALLWKLRKKDTPSGWLTSIGLIILGLQRFLIEFIRSTSPSFVPGFSQAQLMSIIVILFGLSRLVYISLKTESKNEISVNPSRTSL